MAWDYAQGVVAQTKSSSSGDNPDCELQFMPIQTGFSRWGTFACRRNLNGTIKMLNKAIESTYYHTALAKLFDKYKVGRSTEPDVVCGINVDSTSEGGLETPAGGTALTPSILTGPVVILLLGVITGIVALCVESIQARRKLRHTELSPRVVRHSIEDKWEEIHRHKHRHSQWNVTFT